MAGEASLSSLKVWMGRDGADLMKLSGVGSSKPSVPVAEREEGLAHSEFF